MNLGRWTKSLRRNYPTFLTALLLALAIWVIGVNSTDPVTQQSYSGSIAIEVVGQDPGLVLTSSIPSSATAVVAAPNSVWNQLASSPSALKASIDLTGLGPGSHDVPVQIVSQLRPLQIVSQTPQRVTVTLEPLRVQDLPVDVVRTGELAIGWQAGAPVVEPSTVKVSGPQSQVQRVNRVQVTLDMSQLSGSLVQKPIPVQAVDASGALVPGVTVSPAEVRLSISVTQMGGYRNVAVKVAYQGRVADGYHVTNISVVPSVVTLFSADPSLVESLPGYVETQPIDLTGLKDDLDVNVQLKLPDGIMVIGNVGVQVQVNVAAIESTLTLPSVGIKITGLPDGLYAAASPQSVDVIVAGPLPLLDQLKATDVSVVVDLAGKGVGKYQLQPSVILPNGQLRTESILPSVVEVEVSRQPIPSPTPVR